MLRPDDLIESIKAGNNDAIEGLVKEHASWMIAVAWRITRDQALAEDCVQEAFL
ncbi:MAG: RNA polymerase sigma factor, partial [Geminicoccaceae bacterium]